MKKILCILLIFLPTFADPNYAAEIDATFTKPIKRKSYQDYIKEGKEYQSKEQLDSALSSYKQALLIRPQEFAQCIELGNCFLTLGNKFFDHRKSSQAIDAFASILEISSQIAAAHHNLAFTLAEQTGEFDTAIKHYRAALAASPDNIETHFCYSLSLLATGNLIDGFLEYESRWKRYKHSPRSFDLYPMPQQLTHLDVAGKRVFIRVEQGLGDTFHFIRYAKLLKEKGAIIIAEVQEPLAHILGLCNYLDEIVIIGSPIPPYDYQIPLLNLPIIFKTKLETIPAQIPYLRADPLLITYWRNQLAKDGTLLRQGYEGQAFKIGICWRGDAAHGPAKFMPLEYFAQLAQLPNVSLYSLQKNDDKSSNNDLSTKIYQFDADFDNSHGRFMDTAAVMKNLDLIITVDTSVAHLAGGLGVPVWIVLPFPAEWRWLQNRNDSPWYPSMRLFRQKQFSDWNTVIEELMSALQEKLHAKK